MRSEMWRWTARGLGLGLGVAVIAVICWSLLRASNVVLVVVVSILLASGLEPAVGWIRGHSKLGRGPTILVVYAGFFILAGVLVFLIVPSAIQQLGDLGNRLPKILKDLEAYAGTLQPPLSDVVARLARTVRTALNSSSAAPATPDLVAAGVTAADAVITAISILSLTYFWLTGHQRIQRFVLALVPSDARHGAREGWNEVEARLGLWVRGQLILMGTVFAMTTVAYFVLGLEGALLLGLIAGLAEAIPIVGPALGAVPALVVAAATGRVELILLVALVYVVIQILEGNVLVPMVMRSTIGVPPFVVIAALLLGATLGGVVGAFLAVPITAAVVVILERSQDRDQVVPLDGPSGSASETPDTPERDRNESSPADSRGRATGLTD
jgi:predicted PurR-regulated permease PerM